MLNKLLHFSKSKNYWLALLVFSFGLEISALFYQYVLDYLPCVLCIHVRVWLLGIITVAILALKLYRNQIALIGLHLFTSLMFVGLFERSYQLLGTERGFVFGDCNMESGLPIWFALDNWLPSIFKVWEACGYTPELLFGITMAEALIVLSVVLLVISITYTVYNMVYLIQKKTE